MNRRSFTRTVALAALGGVAGIRARNLDYPWKLGIITDEITPDLSAALATFYPKYQLTWAEIRNVKLNGQSKYVYKAASLDQVREIRRQLDGAGVKASVLDTAVYKIPLPGTKPVGEDSMNLNPGEGLYHQQLEDLKHAAAAAHALGTDRVRIFTFSRVTEPDSVSGRVADDLYRAIAVAKQEGVVLLVENEFTCNVATAAESAKLFKTVSDRTLMHCWDPGNAFEAGEEPFPKGWNMLDHSRIGHIHLKDAKGKKWLPIGAGEIDFVGQFEALKKMQYAGTLSLETHYKNAQHDPYSSSVESMDGLFQTLKKV
jgi:L-ribulose-5-phosphate 3-epimerase